MDRLRGVGLKLRPKKCELFRATVKYPGHIVNKEGIATDPDKMAAVRGWPEPHGLTQLQSFLGIVGYYLQYIPDFSNIARPLN